MANLLVELYCGIMELLVEMNGQLTERETEFVGGGGGGGGK